MTQTSQRWIVLRADGSIAEQIFADTAPGDLPDGWSAHATDRFGDTRVERFSAEAGWTDDLVALRRAKWAAVKEKRAAVQFGGCMTPSGPVQTDPTSCLLISGYYAQAVGAMGTGEAWAVDFTFQDNVTRTLSAADMLAVGNAVTAKINAAQRRSVDLRAAISAATTRAELDAIDIESGWP